MRFDRARQHDVATVREVLSAHGVLASSRPGPPTPQYYGQPERLNRDHRASLRPDADRAGRGAVDPMMESLNNLWPRRRLGWMTAAQAWNARTVLAWIASNCGRKWRNVRAPVARKGVKPDVGWRVAVNKH